MENSRFGAGVRWLARHEASLCVLAVLALAVAIIKPALDTGWFGDDAFYSLVPAIVHDGHISWSRMAWESYERWLSNNGRWYPGAVALRFGLFALVHDRFVYKLLLLVLSLVAFEIARRLVAELWGSRFALLALLFAIVCVQVRGYHDPFLAYNGMIQVEAICWFASLWAFAVGVRMRDPRRMVLSLAFLVLPCSVYEIAYLTAPLFLLIARLRRPWSAALRLAAPFAACSIGFALLAVVLHASAPVAPGNMYAIHLDAQRYLAALGDQLAAALPVSYLMFAPPPVASPWWQGFGSHLNPLIFIEAAVVAHVVVRRRDAQPAPLPAGTALFGVLLMLLPALELPLLTKYQQELRPGVGYLPVFIEYIGCGTLIAACVSMRLTKGWQRNAVTAAVALFVGMSAASTDLLAADLQVPYLVSRETFEHALAGGLLGPVPAHANLAIEPEFPWVCHDGRCIDGLATSDLIRHFAKKPLQIVGIADAKFIANFDERAQRWSLHRSPKLRSTASIQLTLLRGRGTTRAF